MSEKNMSKQKKIFDFLKKINDFLCVFTKN